MHWQKQICNVWSSNMTVFRAHVPTRTFSHGLSRSSAASGHGLSAFLLFASTHAPQHNHHG
eukprot:1623402-Amphidinium_carterae.1